LDKESMMNMRKLFAAATLVALSSGAMAADKVCKLEITGTDAMSYDKKELSVAADCTSVELTLKHSGKLASNVMGHNWVLAKTADLNGVAGDGAAAGLTKSYLKDGDARVLAHTKVVGGGQTDTITFPTAALKVGEKYSYFCSFPGHWSMMKGVFKFG
jgi:azurin